jgi:hypothetical protein
VHFDHIVAALQKLGVTNVSAMELLKAIKEEQSRLCKGGALALNVERGKAALHREPVSL